MTRLNSRRAHQGLPTVQPWQVFDMICGTSTGGLIAIMLGRLQMSVEAAITVYVDSGRDVFSETKMPWKEGTYKATNLERAIKIIVGRYGVPETEPPTHPSRKQNERDEQVGSDIKMLQEQATGADRGRVLIILVPQRDSEHILLQEGSTLSQTATFGKQLMLPALRLKYSNPS
ncbi:hypothetical protein FRC12_020890 [Ceratobasidium sp. 428]|nr:hypothetical protein FRC12_020890 [Ceratobasidium sp. 428]